MFTKKIILKRKNWPKKKFGIEIWPKNFFEKKYFEKKICREKNVQKNYQKDPNLGQPCAL